MEEVVTKAVIQHDEGMSHAQTIGIFIINNKSEMLLHKKSSQTYQATSWEPPYFVHHDGTTSPSDIAQLYVDQLGIECELHEAFSPATHSNHIIIALTKEHGPQLHFATEAYKWMPIASVLHAIHDHSKQYASWFKSALEGIQLYLKNIIINQSCDHLPIQSEIQ